jgi:hypothetical protein
MFHKSQTRIQHPDWLRDAHPRILTTLRLWEQGALPELAKQGLVKRPAERSI